VLAADTEVVLDGRVLGKPADAAQASRMLRDLRGREHEVLTGVRLVRTDDGRAAGGVEVTRVRFGDCDDVLIEAYVRTGEPFDKAGAYAIQGRGVLLTAGIDGSWSNVVGLPVERLPGWFAAIGVALGDLVDWAP
jgi:septum formation protein